MPNTKKKKTRRNRRSRKKKGSLPEMRVANLKNMKATYDRLLKYDENSYLVVPRSLSCRNTYNLIKRELLNMGALEVIEEPENSNFLRVLPVKNFDWSKKHV